MRIPLPVPFPIGTVNAWLLPGRRPALIDCGVASSRSYEVLLSALRGAGADPATLHLHVTHGHVDHAGAAAWLARDYGVPLSAHAAEAPFVSDFRRDAKARNDAYADALRRHGMPERDVARLRADSDAVDRYLEDAPIKEPLQHEQRVVLGDHETVVLHTPGHTPGSLCYLLDEATVLTGDTLLERITSNALELREHDFGNYHQYVRTLESLRRFAGATAWPGHKEAFRLTEDIIDRHIDFHRQRAQQILRALEAGPTSAWQVMRRAFPEWSSDPQLFMGMAEVVGHLHALSIEGRVQRVEIDGGWRFAA